MAGFYDLIKAQSSSLIEEHLLLRAGQTWHIEWFFLDTEEELVDFTNATAKAVFKNRDTGATLITFTSGSANNVALGDGSVALVAESTATNLAPDADVEFIYEVKVTLSGKVLTPAAGTGVIKKEITNG